MRKYISILFLLITLSCTSCILLNNEIEVKDGDLVFVVADSHKDFSQAIAQSTLTDKDIQYDHVGIIVWERGVPCVLEANAKYGVICEPMDLFMNAAPRINGKPGVVLMRLKDKDFPIQTAIKKGMSFYNQPYDWCYMPNNGAMYCSELVYESYLNKDGSHLFTARPMSFRDADGNIPQFWQDLFQGDSIPEGVLGTNPNDLAQEPILKEVDRWF